MRLPRDIEKKYKLVNWKGGHRQWFGHRFGWVDVKNITMKHADRLHQLGFSKLELRPKRKQESEAEEPEPTDLAMARSNPPPEKEDCGCGKKKR